MDFIKIEARTLDEAFTKASSQLGCSVSELEVKVLQQPTKGILGIGRKDAIILVRCKKEEPKEEQKPYIEIPQTKEEIFDNFYQEKASLNDITKEIEKELNELFSYGCFNIEPIRVEVFDKETLLVEIKGDDAALLIGKEGYRYKALSYFLFNWIYSRYNLQLRLEIAEFLKTQEDIVKNYLQSVIAAVEEEGRAQTKPLDGVLLQIALKELRKRFPNKYVAIRENRLGEKFIIINDFYK